MSICKTILSNRSNIGKDKTTKKLLHKLDENYKIRAKKHQIIIFKRYILNETELQPKTNYLFPHYYYRGQEDLSLLNQNADEIWINTSVTSLIQELGLPISTEKKLIILKAKIENFLKKKNLKYKISNTLYCDPEFTNQKQIVIDITITTSLKKIYSDLKSSIYNIIDREIPYQIQEYLTINFNGVKNIE